MGISKSKVPPTGAFLQTLDSVKFRHSMFKFDECHKPATILSLLWMSSSVVNSRPALSPVDHTQHSALCSVTGDWARQSSSHGSVRSADLSDASESYGCGRNDNTTSSCVLLRVRLFLQAGSWLLMSTSAMIMCLFSDDDACSHTDINQHY